MLGLTAVAAFDTDHRLGIHVHGRTGAVLAHPCFGNDARDSESFGLAALPVRYSLTFPKSSLSPNHRALTLGLRRRTGSPRSRAWRRNVSGPEALTS